MRKSNIIILILLFSQFVSGQSFSFKMYFEDAIGNKDTLTIGYDINGTDTIDSEFGEINIISVPLDTSFDVRITNEWHNRLYYSIPGTFHTKKQIIKNNGCHIWFSINSIDIFTKNWPVNVSWDNTLFNDTCLNGSLFTSVMPLGWWDTGGFREVLVGSNSLTFAPNYSFYDEWYKYINSNNDTIDVFWQTFGDSTILILGIDEVVNTDIKIFPNPTQNYVTIEHTNQNLNIDEIQVFDINGISQPVSIIGKNLDFSNLPNGLYFIHLTKSNGETITRKIIKKSAK